MRYFLLLIFIPPLLLGLAGATFTSNKLYRMQQIRGWKLGARVKDCVVHDKWQNPQSNGCWLSVTNEDIQKRGNHRINLPAEVWNRYEKGDPIELVFVPDDPSPYHRESVYADDGNFIFDRVLLTIEIGMVLFSLFGAGFTVWYFSRTPPAKPSSRRRRPKYGE